MSLHYAVRGAATAQRMRRQMKRTGLTPRGHKLWTPEEDKIVCTLYPDYKALKKALKRRSYRSLTGRARSLGIAKKRHVWTGAELAKLRKVFPSAPREEIIALLPGIRWPQVYARARYAGLRRARQKLKKTGCPLLDRIRERAFDLNLSMVDLDAMARTKKYFQKAPWWSTGAVSRKALVRAVEALDGKLQVEWE